MLPMNFQLNMNVSALFIALLIVGAVYVSTISRLDEVTGC